MADRAEIRADEALEREQLEDRRDEMTPAPGPFRPGSRDERILTGILSARSMLIGLESQAALRALDDAVRALGEPVGPLVFDVLWRGGLGKLTREEAQVEAERVCAVLGSARERDVG